MIIIRYASINDIQQIRTVASETWISTYKEIYSLKFIDDFVNRAYSDQRLTQVIERDLQDKVRKFLVALNEENELIGYAQVRQETDQVFELLRIYVNPSSQNGGVGTLLINEYIRTLKPVKIIKAWVEKDNFIGRAFYSKRGFRDKEEIVDTIEGHSTILINYELEINKES